ncbi:MAG: Rieske 2Fe-2S domain-containing protein [Marinobacter sp.]|nr:Rieske 2Fe-2S domain-containing protein [Marinobacter sp.]
MKKWHEERNAPEPGTQLCTLAEIPEGEVKEFHFGENIKTRFRMFIYNDGGTPRGYMNMCPHFDVPLNVDPGEMFTTDRSQFMCMMHYARFNVNDGHCTDGPCEGMALERIPLNVIEGQVVISDERQFEGGQLC